MKTEILIKDDFTGEILAEKVITRRPNGSIRVSTINKQPSRTDQQFVKDADINNIMERYAKTGIPPHRTSKTPMYADVSELPDLLTVSNIVHEAQSKFQSLPSQIRERFNNDPAKMIEFLQNPKNQEEAAKLGLLKAAPIKNDDSNDDNLKQQKLSPKKADSKKPDQE